MNAAAEVVAALKACAPRNFHWGIFRIAPAIGFPIKNPKSANVKLTPIRVSTRLKSGDRSATTVGGKDTMAPEKDP